LIATVTMESPPEARTPMALIAVSRMTLPIATGMTISLPPPMNDRVDPAVIATEASATQL